MHVFSIKEETHRGNPVIEILVDGDIWKSQFGYDEHFRFGLRKAKMLIAGMDTIEKFYNSGGKYPDPGEEIDISDENSGIYCKCTRFIGFEKGNDDIDRPYLKFVDKYKNKIGIGLNKANALLDLGDEIKQFIEKHS